MELFGARDAKKNNEMDVLSPVSQSLVSGAVLIFLCDVFLTRSLGQYFRSTDGLVPLSGESTN